MANPTGINQYSKGGGKVGKISVYAMKQILRGKRTKNVFGSGTAVLAHSTGNSGGERYGVLKKGKFTPRKDRKGY